MLAFAYLALFQPDRSPLAFDFILPKRSVTIGRPFNFKVRVTNRTSASIRVVPRGVGATDLRSPLVAFACRRLGSSEWIDLDEHPTCGNTNPVNLSEFVEIEPRKFIELQGWIHWNPKLIEKLSGNAGNYELRLTYRTDAPIDKWIGGPLPPLLHEQRKSEVQAAFDLVPKGVFVTNRSHIRFLAPQLDKPQRSGVANSKTLPAGSLK